MSALLVLSVEGEPFVQVVHLDDPMSEDGYDADYAAAVQRLLPPGKVLRHALVDVTPVDEYGPDDVAQMLTEAGQADYGPTDLPQRWTEVTP